MTVLSRVRTLCFAIAASAAVGLALASGPSAETPPAPCVDEALVTPSDDGDWVEDLAVSNCTYYSNASMTKIVGQFGYDCCNNAVAWGKKTAYKQCGGCFPCFPPDP